MFYIQFSGVEPLTKALKELGAKRIPTHLARAITDTAREAQKGMIRETMSRLTVRGTWTRPGTRFGFNLDRATPVKLQARVFTRAPWLVEQETMEFRTAGQSRIAVPMPAVRASRMERRKIPKRFKPSVMGVNLFPIMTRHGVVLAQRLRRRGLRLMWALERVVRWRRRVHVVDAGVKAAERYMLRAASDQVEAAIREQGLR